MKLWGTCLLVCAVAAVLIFSLPLAIPVSYVAAISASYVAGYNNRAAAILTAIIGVSVLLASWRFQPQTRSSPPAADLADGVGPILTVVVIAVSCAFFAAFGRMLFLSHQRYIADTGYFIEQMSAHAETGRRLYRSLEFAYGPVLFFPTVWLQHWLHCNWLTAYFSTLALEQTTGLLELAFLLNRLPIRPTDRRFGFVLLAVGALNPLLGLNYTLFRFLTPFFLLVLASQSSGLLTSMAVIAVGEVLCLGISAEIGVAFATGAFAFGFWLGLRRNWFSLGICFAPLLGVVIFFLLSGGAYLQMLRSFAKGALNLPVAPYPHLLIFLFAAVWLVPQFLGQEMGGTHPSQRGMVACYAGSIGLLPVALGRCDPLHVFFNGAMLLVLSLAAIRLQRPAVRAIWLSALVLFVLWEQGVTNRLFRFRTADTLSLTVMPQLPAALQDAAVALVGSDTPLADHLQPNWPGDEYKLDLGRLEQHVGNAAVATPLEITPTVEAELKRSHHYRSGYYAFTVDLFSAPSELRKIQDLNRSEWALIPTGYAQPFIELPGNLGDLQGFTFPYRTRHPVPFQAGKAFDANLQQRWTAVDHLGPYTLLRQANLISPPQ